MGISRLILGKYGKKMPAGGTAMFALLAMAGDLGGSIGPGIVGLLPRILIIISVLEWG